MAARSKTAAVKQEAIDHTISFLTELPEKPKDDLSLREAIKQMQAQLKAALAKGCSYVDLAKMLTDKGIKISALTLKNYLPASKRQTTKPITKRPKKAVSDKSVIAAESFDAIGSSGSSASPVEATESATASKPSAPKAATTSTSAPTRARRGQAKSAAKATTGDETSAKPSRTRKLPSVKAPATRRRKQS